MTSPRTPFPDVQAELVALRREIHQSPELAFAEHKTAARVASYLKPRRGVHLRQSVGRTGVVATIGDGGSGATLLRVDMDGLPIQEATGASYSSQSPGIMHACGHDGHVAMGLVATRLLAEGAPHPRPLHVLFQPAEEGQGGAAAVVADGIMTGVERVVGIHLWNEMPVGTIGVKPGALMAAVDRIDIVVRGRGGHGAAPHRSADPIVAASHVIVALQTIVSREVSPAAPAVVTVAAVRGGEAFNVIPDEVVLSGTVRSFEPTLRTRVHEAIHRIATGVAAGLGCRANVRIEGGSDAVINDAGMAEIARAAAAEVVGEANVHVPEATMGGEDVSEYFRHAPGCFVFIGSANAERGLSEPHHSPRFDFDEAALAIGCEFLVRVAGRANAT